MPIHSSFKKKVFNQKSRDTSWENSSRWYNKLVGESGHYYHEHLILPGVVRLFNLGVGESVLDIGCGSGVLARVLPKGVYYQGVDLSASLIAAAKQADRNNQHHYAVADATQTLALAKKDFTHSTMILSLQNMERPDLAIKNTSACLARGGRLVIVLNHPCFRIPRQSGWDINPKSKLQYRWVAKYLSAMKIPIQMHPGKSGGELTWSFHQPLSAYAHYLAAAGLVIESIEEWSSDKKSTSKFKKMEDTARAEIPLFMAIAAKKMG